MKPKEIEDAKRIAPLMRAIRKQYGLNQSSIADIFEVTQAAYSKMERGSLIPSVSQWHSFCKKFDLPMETGFERGYLDRCTPVQMHSAAPETGFKLRSSYRKFARSKVRVVRPTLLYFQRCFGPKKTAEYLRERSIDPDFFLIYDNQINLRFNTELMEIMIKNGFLNKSTLADMVGFVKKKDFHGGLAEKYSQSIGPRDLFVRFIENGSKYDANYCYTIEENSRRGIYISARPTDHMKYFSKSLEPVQEFLHEHKRAFAEHLSMFLGGSGTFVQSIQSAAKGANRCIFRIQI